MLSLSNVIEDEGAKDVLEALNTNASLTELILDSTKPKLKFSPNKVSQVTLQVKVLQTKLKKYFFQDTFITSSTMETQNLTLSVTHPPHY